MMACAQLGITLCGVLLGALGEPAVAALLEPVFAALGVPEAWLHPVALVDGAAAGGLARTWRSARWCRRTSRSPGRSAPRSRWRRRCGRSPSAIGPIIRFLNAFANAVVRADRAATQGRGDLGVHPRGGRRPGRRVAARRGCWTHEEHQRITLGAGLRRHRRSTPVMVPDRRRGGAAGRCHGRRDRADLRTDRVLPLPDPRRRTAGYCGYLHIRDVVDIPADRRDEPVPAARIRALPKVAPSTDLRTALDRMRRIGAHLAEVGSGGRPRRRHGWPGVRHGGR